MGFQETETSELKRVLNDTLPKEIDAFLNSFDGNIYIGVEDDGTVIGVENLDDVQKRIAENRCIILKNTEEARRGALFAWERVVAV